MNYPRGEGGSSSSIAVRAMKVPTDSEWEMISGSSQRGTPERDEGRRDGLQTEGELPGRRTEGELPGFGQGQGERSELRRGGDPGLPQGELPEEQEDHEEEEDPYWEGQWGAQDRDGRWVVQRVQDDPYWEGRWVAREQGQGLEWQEEHPERPEGDRRGLERGYQAGHGEGRFQGPFHFGGDHAPVPLVQQLSTSSGLYTPVRHQLQCSGAAGCRGRQILQGRQARQEWKPRWAVTDLHRGSFNGVWGNSKGNCEEYRE